MRLPFSAAIRWKQAGADKPQTHPVHLAYFNFYTASSHDILAREATLQNRYKELNAAEKYYNAAITALSPSPPLPPPSPTPGSDDEQPSTPESATFPEEQVWLHRLKAGSFDSNASYRTSTSSILSDAFDAEQEDADADADLMLQTFRFPSPPGMRPHAAFESTPKTQSRHIKSDSILSPLSTQNVRPRPALAQEPEQVRLPTGTSSFIGMLQGHLASVRTLKESTGVRGVRFAFPTPSPSPTKSWFRQSQTSQQYVSEEREKELLRQKRRGMIWRPRFDPQSVRQLCDEALAEL